MSNIRHRCSPVTSLEWYATATYGGQIFSSGRRKMLWRPASNFQRGKLLIATFLTKSNMLHIEPYLIFVFLAVQNSTIGDLVPCLVGLTKLTIRVFTRLQSDPRDLRPLRHLIKVMRRCSKNHNIYLGKLCLDEAAIKLTLKFLLKVWAWDPHLSLILCFGGNFTTLA